MTNEKGKLSHIFLFLIVFSILIWSVIKPEEGLIVWLIEVLPSIVVLLFLLIAYNKFRLTTISYSIIALLSILTFIGGHFSYSKVPLFNWIKDYFDLQRNHYDRFGHFLKGLVVIVILEILLRKTKLIKSKITTIIALCISLAIGSLYEIIEWGSTLIFKEGKATKDFLGMQGDIWDAQWDMSLLLIGSILAVIFLSKRLYNQLKNK